MAKDWSGYLTEESAARRPSALKAAFRHLSIPGIISLGGGLPLPAYFPIHEVTVKVPRMGKWSEKETATHGQVISIAKYPKTRPAVIGEHVNGINTVEWSDDALAISRAEVPTVGLSTTLQYGLGTGEPNLVGFLKQHTQMVHHPPYEDWSTTLTCGNTYSFYTCLRMLVERGDYIVMEDYTYSSAISTCGPLGIKVVGVDMDEQGMTPQGLDYTMMMWDVRRRGARKPRVIYLVPYLFPTKQTFNEMWLMMWCRTGQNPTGASMSLRRRKEIYGVCQKHNLIIIEDEPYYFLQMDPYNGKPTPVPDLNSQGLVNALTPSFLSLDVDGRVLRLDSLSKTVAPGLRLAWISGPAQLTERVLRHLELSTQAPAGLSQSVVYDLLAKHWSHDGFLGWLGYIRKEYTRRRDVAAEALDQHIPRGVASWTVPTAGMFFWVKITAPQSFWYEGSLEQIIFERCLEEKVLVIPGGFFKADGDPEGSGGVGLEEDGTCYFRGTFAAAEEDEVVRGIERFGKSIRAVFDL